MTKFEIIKYVSFIIIIFSRFCNINRISYEIYQLKKYYELCKEGILIRKNNFKKVDNPKISVIVPVYNREKYLLQFLRSIQNQYFNDIEIILVDDSSTDNSQEIIKKLKNEDERIILLKNKINKGTFISRNIAGLKAKGEYLIFPDPDDIVSPFVFDKCYHAAKKFNFELIRFHMYSDRKYVFSLIPEALPKIVSQPDLRTHLVYGFGYENITDGILNNKFVSKILFVTCLNSINEYYLKKKLIYFEDGIINFSFYQHAKSIYLYRIFGYYYFTNPDSISKEIKINSYFECFFVFLKFVFENTKNILIEKNMTFYFLHNYIKNNEILYKISNYSTIYKRVIKQISKSDFISPFFQQKLKSMELIISNLKLKKRNKVSNIAERKI